MKLYSQGLRPVFRVMPNHQKSWKRIPGKINYSLIALPPSEAPAEKQPKENDDEEGGTSNGGIPQQFLLSFTHNFNHASTETAYFAFTYPFSYQESVEHVDRIEELVTRPEHASNIYFHRENLFYSREGRKMEIFTISSRDGLSDEQEDQV